jgi:SAM-dependent methyltransferase
MPNEIAGLRVLDVGCGLGDNAECFAGAGACVTAFDFVSGNEGTYAQRDLLPEARRQGFDLDHECYTLQALSPVLLPQTLAALGSLLAPGGKLLIVARARDEASETKGPPWPLPSSIFEDAKRQNLEPVSIEDIRAAPGVTARIGVPCSAAPRMREASTVPPVRLT